MPSEQAFVKQAELARKALKSFYAVLALDAPVLIRAALVELVDSTVRLIFIFFFLPSKPNLLL